MSKRHKNVKIPHDNGTGVYFSFYAIADEWAGIDKVWCECGYKKEIDESASHESTWKCPACNKEVQFRWQGMSWRLVE